MKIILGDVNLQINLNALEKVGAAKGSIVVSYSDVVSAFSEKPTSPDGMKLVGTNLPGMIELGTYLAGTQKEFWYTKKGKNNFLVLVLKSNFYSRVIIETEESDDLAQKITEKLEKI